MPYVYLLPELILSAVALGLLLAVAWAGRERAARFGPVVAFIGFAAAIAAVYPALGQVTLVFGQMLAVDGYTQFFKVVFLAVGALIAVASSGYMKRQDVAAGEYYVLLMFAIVGMILMASSTDLLVIWLGLELVSITSYVLAGYLRHDPKSNEAAIKYFLTGSLATAVLLFGLSLIYGLAGTTNLSGISQALEQVAGFYQGGQVVAVRPAVDPRLIVIAIFMLVAGFGFKVALVPFHMWAPDTYEGAPTPVTAFFSIGPKGAGLAALVRIFPLGLAALQPRWSVLFAILAAATMTVGNLSALNQTNIKRMMAYSSIAQVGYITVGLAVASPLSIAAIIYYVMAYVFINAGLFSVIILLDQAGVGQKVKDYAGLSQRAPATAAAMVVFFVALIGIPFTSGFFAKFFIFSSAVEGGFLWLAILLAVNSAISVGYYYGVVRQMYLEPPREDQAIKVPGPLAAVLVTGAVATLAMGVFSEPFLRLIGLIRLAP
ncbi:MAG TPA: NADH-quinone oxidoreductase subunit N [Bacillota bacterium]